MTSTRPICARCEEVYVDRDGVECFYCQHSYDVGVMSIPKDYGPELVVVPKPKEPSLELWEVLVPTVSNDGKPFRTRYHRVWDEKVRAITGGLTILAPAKGQWKDETGELYVERMIPVRIACDRVAIDEIIDITMEYYDQLAVMAYRVSDECIIKRRDPKEPGYTEEQSVLVDFAGELYGGRPGCDHEVYVKTSGVACRKCPGWFCH